MLEKINRITKKKEFDRVFSHGRASHDFLFVMKVLPNVSSCARIGVIVSNKISKNAVVRNRVKRRVRHAIREIFGSISAVDTIIIAKPPVVNAGYSELKNSISRHFAKLGACRNKPKPALEA